MRGLRDAIAVVSVVGGGRFLGAIVYKASLARRPVTLRIAQRLACPEFITSIHPPFGGRFGSELASDLTRVSRVAQSDQRLCGKPFPGSILDARTRAYQQDGSRNHWNSCHEMLFSLARAKRRQTRSLISQTKGPCPVAMHAPTLKCPR